MLHRWEGFIAWGVLLASCAGQAASDPPAVSEAQGGATPAPVCDGSPAPLAPAPCPPGYFYYTDEICGPELSGSACVPDRVGDQLCHQTCTTDADCSDPCRPHCRTLGLYAHGDYNCDAQVRVCGTSTVDDC